MKAVVLSTVAAAVVVLVVVVVVVVAAPYCPFHNPHVNDFLSVHLSVRLSPYPHRWKDRRKFIHNVVRTIGQFHSTILSQEVTPLYRDVYCC
jgi:hypothetical protein